LTVPLPRRRCAIPLSDEDRFNIELLKLLVQAAWSDQALSPQERSLILGVGRSWSVPEPELRTLLERLEAGGELPAPDMEVLRRRPDDVLEAVQALSAADGRLAGAEKALLSLVTAALGASSA
jgi:tellurite resistance protein